MNEHITSTTSLTPFRYIKSPIDVAPQHGNYRREIYGMPRNNTKQYKSFNVRFVRSTRLLTARIVDSLENSTSCSVNSHLECECISAPNFPPPTLYYICTSQSEHMWKDCVWQFARCSLWRTTFRLIRWRCIRHTVEREVQRRFNAFWAIPFSIGSTMCLCTHSNAFHEMQMCGSLWDAIDTCWFYALAIETTIV